jgi:AmmeMemoRadiSam system protein A
MNQEYTLDEKKELLTIARAAILGYLKNSKREYPRTTNPKFLEKRGVFVTLHKRGDLRGCIGYPLPTAPLIHGVVDNAIAAAMDDPRFTSVNLEELNTIDIEISILTVPKKRSSYKDIVIGKDGIIISQGFMRGLLLPQVPVEQKWNKEQYVSYGCLKAGLSADEWKRGVDIETFQAVVFGENENI